MISLSKLLTFLPLLVQLNDKEKKAIGIVAAVVLCVLLLVGLLARLLLAVKDRQGRKIDSYMYDMVQYKVIETPLAFRNYVFKRESKLLYLHNRWYLRILIVVAALIGIYIVTVLKGDYQQLLTIFKDFFVKINWPTTTLFGLNIINDWPQIEKAPKIYTTVNGYITYIGMLVGFVVGIKLICSAFSYYAKLDRSNKVSTKAFGKNLDNLANGGGPRNGFE